jgi:hypothetical protein
VQVKSRFVTQSSSRSSLGNPPNTSKFDYPSHNTMGKVYFEFLTLTVNAAFGFNINHFLGIKSGPKVTPPIKNRIPLLWLDQTGFYFY